MKRMKSEDIKAGKSYKLVGVYNPYSCIRKVEKVVGDKFSAE